MMTLLMIAAVGAAFANPQAVEQALDNSPQAARVALEETLDQATVDALETKLVPKPTPEQQEADLKTAKALLIGVAEDPKTDKAVEEVQKKLDCIEAAKPKPEIVEPVDMQPNGTTTPTGSHK
jgi:hypothetical protein